MTKPKTNVIIVLDKSGSMAYCKEATIAGYNDQLSAIKSFQKTQKVNVSRITFDNNAQIDYWMQSAKMAEQLSNYNYVPSGGTALRDAVGLGLSQALVNEDKTASYLMIIVSDGQENSSRIWSADALASKIKELQETERWTFTYLGANQDLTKVSREMNIPLSNMARYDSSDVGTRQMFMAASANISSSYMAARDRGETLKAGVLNTSGEEEVADFASTTTTSKP